jgi:hypothetical protein
LASNPDKSDQLAGRKLPLRLANAGAGSRFAASLQAHPEDAGIEVVLGVDAEGDLILGVLVVSAANKVCDARENTTNVSARTARGIRVEWRLLVLEESFMAWILLEAGLALALALFIVWWTLPREGKNKSDTK